MKLSALFSDHMVFQRGKPIRIWGIGEGKVSVTLNSQTLFAACDKNGKWRITFPPLSAGGPYKITLTDSVGTAELNDVMIGEVWLASGQSNMEMITGLTKDGFKFAKEYGKNSNIRLFTVPRRTEPDFRTSNWHFEGVAAVDTPWQVCTEENALHFSAIGFYFADYLQRKENITVGIISCNFGGARIESFIDSERIFECDELSYLKARCQETLKTLDLDEHKKDYERHMRERDVICNSVDALSIARNMADMHEFAITPLFKWPEPFSFGPYHWFWPGVFYENMVKRIAPFHIKGVLWYQGEANAVDSQYYCKLFEIMVKLWREIWNDSEMPFITVQLAQNNHAPAPECFPLLIEQQIKASRKIDNVYIVTTSDIGEKDNIHSIKKHEIGERIFLAAESEVYGNGGEYCGPLYKSARKAGNKLFLSFEHAENGLKIKGGAVSELFIAGAGGEYKPANAEINGSELVVWNDEISNPQSVKMAFNNFFEVNLYNKEGFIAAPFRTGNIE